MKLVHRVGAAVACVVVVGFAAAAGAEAPRLVDKNWYNLWADKAPGAKGVDAEDTPAVQVFLPSFFGEKATGASFVVCPGGGYGGRAAHEGPVVGEWFARKGITAFVLRYRVGPKGYHHPIQMTDASRAVRFVRTYSKEWGLDPQRIGIMGFSAGGHLASTVATHWDEGKADASDPVDRASSRPDVQVLIYPVITMAPNVKAKDGKPAGGGHDGSRNNLFGKDKANDKELIALLSNEKHVNAKTPPAFLVHAIEDKAVPVSNSDDYAAALKAAGVEVEYIRPEKGPHGFGLQEWWTKKCIEWLRKQKF